MEIQKLVFVIADISGYTRFITRHRRTLMHAERIIGNLLEAVIAEAKSPLVVHELLGDAVTMYAPLDDDGHVVPQIFNSLYAMHHAFEQEETQHISECSICSCDACKSVGRLNLKFVAHAGEAVFSTVGGRKKISGEDVIVTHRCPYFQRVRRNNR